MPRTFIKLAQILLACGPVLLTPALIAADGTKALGPVPTIIGPPRPPPKLLEAPSGDSVHENGGLFVGINEFKANSQLPKLRYAVDDAIELANAFVVKAGVLAPANVVLALSGSPSTKERQDVMDELVRRGVKVVEPTRNELLGQFRKLKSNPVSTNSLMVWSFSTHGFGNNEEVWLMPSDGMAFYPEESGIKLAIIQNSLRGQKGNKRLLIIDACREAVGGGTKGLDTLTPAFKAAFEKSEGMAALMSCDVGQLSHEDDELGQGVFTHFLLEGLLGKAASEPASGIIRIGAVATYAIEKTEEYVKSKKGRNQEPVFIAGKAEGIPVAVYLPAKREYENLQKAKSDLFKYFVEASMKCGEANDEDFIQNIRTSLLFGPSGQSLSNLIARLERIKHYGGDTNKQATYIRLFKRTWDKQTPSK